MCQEKKLVGGGANWGDLGRDLEIERATHSVELCDPKVVNPASGSNGSLFCCELPDPFNGVGS